MVKFEKMNYPMKSQSLNFARKRIAKEREPIKMLSNLKMIGGSSAGKFKMFRRR